MKITIYITALLLSLSSICLGQKKPIVATGWTTTTNPVDAVNALGGGIGGNATNAIGKTNGFGYGITTVDSLKATNVNASSITSSNATLTGQFNGVYTPEQFGAYGDGVHDDTLSVQCALSASATNGVGPGGAMQLQRGRSYLVTQPLWITNAQNFILHGDGAWIYWGTNSPQAVPITMQSCSASTVENLNILIITGASCSNVIQIQQGIGGHSSNQDILRNIVISCNTFGCFSNGVSVWPAIDLNNDNHHFERVTVDGCANSGFTVDGFNGLDITLTSCDVWSQKYGLTCGQLVPGKGGSFRWYGGYISGIGSNSIAFLSCPTRPSIVSGMSVENCGRLLWTTATATGQDFPTTLDNVFFSGLSLNPDGYAIWFTGTQLTVRDSRIGDVYGPTNATKIGLQCYGNGSAQSAPGWILDRVVINGTLTNSASIFPINLPTSMRSVSASLSSLTNANYIPLADYSAYSGGSIISGAQVNLLGNQPMISFQTNSTFILSDIRDYGQGININEYGNEPIQFYVNGFFPMMLQPSGLILMSDSVLMSSNLQVSQNISANSINLSGGTNLPVAGLSSAGASVGKVPTFNGSSVVWGVGALPSMVVTNTESGVTLSGSFNGTIGGILSGGGSGITNLNGANLQAGTVNSNSLDAPTKAQLALSGALLSNNNNWTGSNNFSSSVTFSSPPVGDGSGMTNLHNRTVWPTNYSNGVSIDSTQQTLFVTNATYSISGFQNLITGSQHLFSMTVSNSSSSTIQVNGPPNTFYPTNTVSTNIAFVYPGRECMWSFWIRPGVRTNAANVSF